MIGRVMLLGLGNLERVQRILEVPLKVVLTVLLLCVEEWEWIVRVLRERLGPVVNVGQLLLLLLLLLLLRWMHSRLLSEVCHRV